MNRGFRIAECGTYRVPLPRLFLPALKSGHAFREGGKTVK